MEIKFLLKDEKLIIRLNDTIDTSNADEVENKINEIISSNSFNKLVLDGEDLKYISSVGLRVILRIKKNYNELKIINISSEVYEIFESTGFNQIIDIEKAYKVISIEGKNVIGEGFYGRVYRISPDTIVKVYFRGGDVEMVHHERKLARKAFVLGIPTAISYDVVKIKEGGFYGSVFELLDAKSLRDIIRDDEANIEKYLDMYADLIKTINNTEIFADSELPNAKDVSKDWLARIKPCLKDDIFVKLESLFANMKDNNHLLHGDCHVKNIMVQNNEPILIDMDTLAKGNCVFEYSAMFLTYIAYEMSEPGNCKSFIGLEKETCKHIFDGLMARLFKGRENELDSAMKKIKVLGAVLLLYRSLEFYTDFKERIDLCVNWINQYVPELDTLEI